MCATEATVAKYPVRNLTPEDQLREYFAAKVGPKPAAIERVGGTRSTEPHPPEFPPELTGRYDDVLLLVRVVEWRLRRVAAGFPFAVSQDPALRKRARALSRYEFQVGEQVKNLVESLAGGHEYLESMFGVIDAHGKDRVEQDRLAGDTDACRVALDLYKQICNVRRYYPDCHLGPDSIQVIDSLELYQWPPETEKRKREESRVLIPDISAAIRRKAADALRPHLKRLGLI
jgi:hypothetical protein